MSPIRIGSMVGPRGRYRFLKADAPYPGDPAVPGHWIEVEPLPGQSGPLLCTFVPGFQTRAVLLAQVVRGTERAVIDPGAWRFWSARLHNIAPGSAAAASREHTPARNLAVGQGAWTDTVVDQRGTPIRAPVSELDPAWVALDWGNPQPICGLAMMDNFEKFEIYLRQQGRSGWAWNKLPEFHVAPGSSRMRLVGFAPTSADGVRIKVLRTAEPRLAQVNGLHVYTDLGTAAAPNPVPSEPTAPVYEIPYEVPGDGYVTLAIDDAQGRRVRNLATRAWRTAGPHRQDWDLKNDAGNTVPAGTYRLRAITHPGLRLTYCMTPYPNVESHAPENSPWLNDRGGPGGWLSDHACAECVATAGDRVYFGAITPEFGAGFIATDLQGRKLWGIGSFGSFMGAGCVAADASNIFVAKNYSQRPGDDRIWRVDAATHDFTLWLERKDTPDRKTGIRALALRDGRLYVSIQGSAGFLANAGAASQVDIENCLPSLPPTRPSRGRQDYPADWRGDFLRLFRMQGTPPGLAASGQPVGHIGLVTEKTRRSTAHLVLSFSEPVPVGSLVYPAPEPGVRLRLSLLKPSGAYPPRPDRAEDWIDFGPREHAAWNVAPAPEAALTRALRLSFTRGDFDNLSTVLDDGSILSRDEPAGGGGWMGQLDGMKILRRRVADVAPRATVRVSSGRIARDGTWDAERSEPISRENPAVYTLQWPQAQTLCGLAIKELEAWKAEVDVWTGDGPPEPQGTAGWEKVADYTQELRDLHSGFASFNGLARYMDGYVDFGRQIAARGVRIRVVQPYLGDIWRRGADYGFRVDREPGYPSRRSFDAKRCRLYGVAALSYLGGEPPASPLITDRVEIFDATGAEPRLLREVHVPKPGKLAFGPDGTLYAVSDGKVVAVKTAGTRSAPADPRPVVTDLKRPLGLAADRRGRLYVFDADPDRQNVRVYDQRGALQGQIGSPGGYRVGPWDVTRMETGYDLAIDANEKLWVVERHDWPKRITRWSLDGAFEKEFLGPTHYGGGGVLNPFDKSQLFLGPLEFALDWDAGRSRLKALTWRGDSPAGEVPLRLGSIDYMVTRGDGSRSQRVGVVYRYVEGRLKRLAALGLADAFEPLKQPALLSQLKGRTLEALQFVWADRNGDGEPQIDEVSFSPRRFTQLSNFAPDLSIVGGYQYHGTSAIRFAVAEFLPGGAPVFREEKPLSLAPGTQYPVSPDLTLCLGMPNQLAAPDGRPVWQYRTLWSSMSRPFPPGPMTPDQVVGEFNVVGHAKAGAGDLGEFFVVNANTGSWNLWTRDGLLAGRIFEDLRWPASRPWSMREHQRGLPLDGINVNQEHFRGWFCKLAGVERYFAVAGKNHASVVEVTGLDRFRRLDRDLAVTAEDLRRALAHDAQQARRQAILRDVSMQIGRMTPPNLDGQTESGEWPACSATLEEMSSPDEVATSAAFSAGYDDRNLYLCYKAAGLGPLKNTGHDWRTLFKTGASVEVQIGVDSKAPWDRAAPATGDKRLLMTWMGDTPTAVLYEPVAPGAAAEEGWATETPAGGRTAFDRVTRLPGVSMARSDFEEKGRPGYVVEAAVPLADLRLTMARGTRLRFDWGLIATGPDGHEAVRRIFWSNQAAGCVSDEPTEARLHPDLWGTAWFVERRGDEGPRLSNESSAMPAGDHLPEQDIEKLLER